MIRKAEARINAVAFWNDWGARIWRRGYAKWLSRDRQDNYYRERVVFPALLRAIEERVSDRSVALVDLGAGDGYTTARLSMLLRDRGFEIQSIVMLDRSRHELEAAQARPQLRRATSRYCNFLSRRGARTLQRFVRQDATTIMTATFVLQELPDIVPMLYAVSEILGSDGVLLAVIVAPEFAEELRRQGDAKVVHESSSSLFDWSWAGLYPIAVPSGALRLPHFQYSRRKFRELFAKAGLRIRNMRELTLPNDRDTRQVFGRTIYGDAILGKPSSLLITATRGNGTRAGRGGYDA